MGPALLPIEKLPLFVWGAVLAAIGGFLVAHEAWLTWPQLRAFGILLTGLAAVAYDLTKRIRRAQAVAKKPNAEEAP